MKILLAIFCLTLPSCVFKVVERGLTDLEGKPIETAFGVLGYPSGKMDLDKQTLYEWSTNYTRSLPMMQTANTFGSVGMTPFQAQTNSLAFIPQQQSGSIKIAAGKSGLIENWSYNGNEGGLIGYARSLERYSKSLKSQKRP